MEYHVGHKSMVKKRESGELENVNKVKYEQIVIHKHTGSIFQDSVRTKLCSMQNKFFTLLKLCLINENFYLFFVPFSHF